MRRLDAVQRWPVEKNAPWTAQFTATVEVGVVEHHQRILAAHLELDLAPCARRSLRRSRRPVATEPVKLTPSTSGDVEQRLADHRAAAHHEVEHARRQPGAPMISASAQAQPGTRSAGLKTTQLP